MEVIITPDVELLYQSHKETNNVTQLNPRPVYQQSARSNATNSELDAKQVVVNNANKSPRLNETEWDIIFNSIDNKYKVIRDKLLSYKAEDVIVNRLCDTNLSAYDSIPTRY